MRIDERTGCALLKERFTQAGYDIQDNYAFAEGDVVFQMDGFDPARRVGFEYITTEAGDRQELHPGLLSALEQRLSQGHLHVLLIDEDEVDGAEALRQAADRFLAHVRGLVGGAS